MGYSPALTILGVVFAFAATILLYILVIPEKKYESLPKFFKAVADIFNFKSLLIEKVLKVLYTFSTMLCLFVGFFMLFNVQSTYFGTTWLGGYGFLVMILGPIVTRLAYEMLMMFILLVNNVIQINKKLKSNAIDEESFEQTL